MDEIAHSTKTVRSVWLTITVIDEGDGFSPAALRHAKQWLYQDDASRHSANHHGIGLATANTTLSEQGGTLELTNNTADDTAAKSTRSIHGAKVTMTIPCEA